MGSAEVETIPERIIDSLNIDPELVLIGVREFIYRKYKEYKADGIAIGLSGGIDSAVVTAIAARAIDPARVHALHLFDRESQPHFLKYAKKLADTLHIRFESRDITGMVDELVRYRRRINKTKIPCQRLRNSSLIRSISKRVYILIHKSNPFILTFRQVHPVKRLCDILISPTTIRFHPSHIIRRHILETYAAEKNLLSIGAANRSEALTEWFVKSGIDDLPIEPIMGLYKNQVYQLARFLQIPSAIIEEPPSPDFVAGLSDEVTFGLSWEKIDTVLYLLENGSDMKVVLKYGITLEEFNKVWLRYQNAKKNRGNIYEYPV